MSQHTLNVIYVWSLEAAPSSTMPSTAHRLPLYFVLMLRHVAVATYDTEIYVPGSQTLRTARINTIHKRKAAQCSVATMTIYESSSKHNILIMYRTSLFLIQH
jgi:hypothetical protein